ncbi:hypothetical protein Rsub_09170 [Raphidocelis subcapitata]|uniref:Uncharacterized protein n=1 Tax=Raphidocelis subcapitata TaxID=307507 RepID=A0A2V0P938_9CHLO|nr:hypothetical protein Rsub_09170 [Raphidocelis subcapitata]|eukprot:GBF96371.1 hypothetical protein Rsub_09170 [Raphidocelis subcapitata]
MAERETAALNERAPWVYERQVDGPVDDPGAQISVQIHNGKLIVTVNGDIETVQLPDDAFTTHAAAEYRRHRLAVTVPRRDPNGPAMLEKRMFDPDTRPRDVSVTLPHATPAARKMADKAAARSDPRRGPTPAEAELGERNADMYGEAQGYEMPQANMGSVVATANPVIFEKGGAVDTPSQGETVVPVAGSAETRRVLDAPGAGLAGRMGRASLRDAPANAGGAVLFGQREKEVERDFGGGRGAAGAPAGAEGEEGAEAGRGEGGAAGSVPVDWADEKVGMERRVPRAADAYPATDSARNEPVSSVKQPGEACDVCACNPCQCDKLRSTYRLSPPETKRSGKPHLHTKAKPVTGVNSHEAHDYRRAGTRGAGGAAGRRRGGGAAGRRGGGAAGRRGGGAAGRRGTH